MKLLLGPQWGRHVQSHSRGDRKVSRNRVAERGLGPAESRERRFRLLEAERTGVSDHEVRSRARESSSCALTSRLAGPPGLLTPFPAVPPYNCSIAPMEA